MEAEEVWADAGDTECALMASDLSMKQAIGDIIFQILFRI